MSTETLQEFTRRPGEAGFVTDTGSDSIFRGLGEDVIRIISAERDELMLKRRPMLDKTDVSSFCFPEAGEDTTHGSVQLTEVGI